MDVKSNFETQKRLQTQFEDFCERLFNFSYAPLAERKLLISSSPKKLNLLVFQEFVKVFQALLGKLLCLEENTQLEKPEKEQAWTIVFFCSSKNKSLCEKETSFWEKWFFGIFLKKLCPKLQKRSESVQEVSEQIHPCLIKLFSGRSLENVQKIVQGKTGTNQKRRKLFVAFEIVCNHKKVPTKFEIIENKLLNQTVSIPFPIKYNPSFELKLDWKVQSLFLINPTRTTIEMFPQDLNLSFLPLVFVNDEIGYNIKDFWSDLDWNCFGKLCIDVWTQFKSQEIQILNFKNLKPTKTSSQSDLFFIKKSFQQRLFPFLHFAFHLGLISYFPQTIALLICDYLFERHDYLENEETYKVKKNHLIEIKEKTSLIFKTTNK